MKYLLLVGMCMSLAFLTSCETEDYKEKDKDYPRYIYIVQNGTSNGILTWEVESGDVLEKKLSVYCSGITSLNKNIEVEVFQDTQKLNSFIEGEADAGDNTYDPLPEGALSITAKGTIKKGTEMCELPYTVTTSSLESGKSYLFVVTIKSVSDFEVSEKEASLFCCVKVR